MLALMDSTGTISQELLPVNESESEQSISQVQVQQPISLLLPDHLLLNLKSRRCEAFFSKKNNKSDLSPRSRSDPYFFTKKKWRNILVGDTRLWIPNNKEKVKIF